MSAFFGSLLGMGNGMSGAAAKTSPWLLETLSEHEASLNCMALSEDGSVLATGSDDCSIRLWTTATTSCQCLGVLRGHHKYITCLAIEEGCVLSASADRTIKKWDMSTGTCSFTFEGHSGMVNRIICTGDFIFSSSYDTTARCWVFEPDLGFESNPCIRIFRGHTKGVYPMIFILADEDWKEEEPDLTDLLITGSGDGTARSWSVETGKCLAAFRGHTGPVNCLGMDGETKILFTGSADGSIRSWDILKAEPIKVFQGHSQPITAFLVANKFLYSGSADRTAKSWVIEFGDCARTYRGHKHSISCIFYHEGLLYTGCGDGLVRAFDVKSGVLRRVFQGHLYTVNCLRIVNGKLFTGSFDNSLRVWSLKGIRNATDPYKMKEGEAELIQDAADPDFHTRRRHSDTLSV